MLLGGSAARRRGLPRNIAGRHHEPPQPSWLSGTSIVERTSPKPKLNAAHTQPHTEPHPGSPARLMPPPAQPPSPAAQHPRPAAVHGQPRSRHYRAAPLNFSDADSGIDPGHIGMFANFIGECRECWWARGDNPSPARHPAPGYGGGIRLAVHQRRSRRVEERFSRFRRARPSGVSDLGHAHKESTQGGARTQARWGCPKWASPTSSVSCSRHGSWPDVCGGVRGVDG